MSRLRTYTCFMTAKKNDTVRAIDCRDATIKFHRRCADKRIFCELFGDRLRVVSAVLYRAKQRAAKERQAV